MSKPLDERTFKMRIPPTYVCTGNEEEGIQEGIIEGVSYFFYLANIHAGSKIIEMNGHLYTDDPTMTVTLPASTDVETVPSAETSETLTIEGRGQGGTEQGGDYYGTIPEQDQGQNVETLRTYEADGTPRLYIKRNGAWIEIPLISSEEVTRLQGGGLLLTEVEATQRSDGSLLIS